MSVGIIGRCAWSVAGVAILLGLAACNGDDPPPAGPTDGSAVGDTDPATDGDTAGPHEDTPPGEDTGGDATVGDAEDDAGVELAVGWTAELLELGEEFVLRGVWGESADALVAVGNKSTIIEYGSNGWKLVHQNTDLDTLNAVWGVAMDDVWAVGAHGAILHRDVLGWNVGTGCSSDAACDDGDPCTVDSCGADGTCVYGGSGQPGCCGTTTYGESWESGALAGWTVVDISAGKTGMVWHAAALVDQATGEPRATDGQWSLYFGDPTKPCSPEDPTVICHDFDNGQIVGATATSPQIKLPAAASVTVEFDVFIDTESGASYDKLELRLLENAVPHIVWTKEDVGGVTGMQFVEASADITAYAGKAVQLQFWFDSSDSIANSGEGVFVDDLKVTSECGDATTGLRFPTLWDVWGSGSDNVFAVGNEGTIIHFDGTSWKRQAGGEANDLFGLALSADFVAAGGAEGEVVTNFGGGLSVDSAATNATLRAMAIVDGDTAYGFGDGGTIVRHQNGSWTEESSGLFADLQGAWTDGVTTVVVGSGGTILRGSGGSWVPENTAEPGTLYDVWGASASDMLAVGEKGVLLEYADGAWTKAGNLTSAELRGVHGFGSAGPWFAVGGGGSIVQNLDGVWEVGKSPTSLVLHGVWGANPNDVWAVGNLGVMVRFDGTSWTEFDSPTGLTLYDVDGRSATDMFAIGAGGVMAQWDGVEWSVVRSNTTVALRAVWGLGPDDVYAVGAGATIMHFNGLNWSQIKVEDQVIGGEAVPVTDQLFDLWGTSPTNIWAAGIGGAVIHTEVDDLTGDLTWVKIPQDQNEVTVRGIWGFDAENMWLVGREGTVVHFNGGTYTPEETLSISTLYDVIGFGDTDLIAVGDLGTVLRRGLVPAE